MLCLLSAPGPGFKIDFTIWATIMSIYMTKFFDYAVVKKKKHTPLDMLLVTQPNMRMP